MHIISKSISIMAIHIISGDTRTDFGLSIEPTADKTIIKIKIQRFV